MKATYGIFPRDGGMLYSVHYETGKQKSLRTRDRVEGERLLAALNSQDNSIALNRELARVYMMSAEPDLNSRTWRDVLDSIIAKHKNETTRNRYITASKDKHLIPVLGLKIAETTSAEIFKALNKGTVSTNIFPQGPPKH